MSDDKTDWSGALTMIVFLIAAAATVVGVSWAGAWLIVSIR